MKILVFLITLSLSVPLFAQKVEISDDPQTVEVGELPSDQPVYKEQPTGKGAAQKFFKKDSKNTSESSSSYSAEDHYLMVGLGSFVNSKSYKWGAGTMSDTGEFNAGVTYRFGEWVNSTDFLVRVEYQTFDLDSSEDPKKFSILPMILFPDARSGFPLYFGGGIGLGIFMDQLEDESSLSFDYQIVLGGRMLNVFNSLGFFVETGIKNHLHILSSGQFDGVFVTFGSVFTF